MPVLSVSECLGRSYRYRHALATQPVFAIVIV